MEEKGPEEKAPLLLYLSDANEGAQSKNNKRISFEKGRLYGISSGATAVFTEFPNIVSNCWLTTVLSALAAFMIFILMFSSLSNNANYIRVPRCIHKSNSTLENSTIHLVHEASEWNSNEIEILERIIEKFPGYKIHILVLDFIGYRGSSSPATTRLSNLQKVTYLQTPLVNTNQTQPLNSHNHTNNNHTTYQIVHKHSTTGALGKILMYRPLKRVKRKKIDDSFDFSVKRLLDLLLHTGRNSLININGSVADAHFPIEISTKKPKPKFATEFPNFYPNVVVERLTYQQAFNGTPLAQIWMSLNERLTIFAARVLQLWQYGGLSFCLHANKGKLKTSEATTVQSISIISEIDDLLHGQQNLEDNDTNDSPNTLFDFVDTGRKNYENLPSGVVSADKQGFHIFSKLPCHAFFGEVLLKLKVAKQTETIDDIIRKSLVVFCQYSASTRKQYCQTLIQKIKTS